MITAVLLRSGMRDKELDLVVRDINKRPEITEIIVHDNRKDNVFTYGRFLAAKKARNDVIYTQDDDCLVKNFRSLLSLYDDTCIVNALTPKAMKKYTGKETLLGWGSLFNKYWYRVFDKWIDKYGEDYLMYRGGDRIFTTLVGKHKTIEADLDVFSTARDKSVALCYRKDYKETIEKVRQRLKELQ
jgi:hypothetical protein